MKFNFFKKQEINREDVINEKGLENNDSFKKLRTIWLSVLMTGATFTNSPAQSVENLGIDPTKEKIENTKSPEEKKKEEAEYLTKVYEKTDSTIVADLSSKNNESMGKINLFGFKQLDSLARANNVNLDLYINNIDMKAIEKELDKPSYIEGKKVREVMDKYILCVVPKMEGKNLNYERILKLYGIKSIEGANAGNQEEKVQKAELDCDMLLFPINPVFDSLTAGEQAMKVETKTNHHVSRYNETLYKYLALKTINPQAYSELAKNEIPERVFEPGYKSTGKSFAGFSMESIGNTYAFLIKDNEKISIYIEINKDKVNIKNQKNIGIGAVSRINYIKR